MTSLQKKLLNSSKPSFEDQLEYDIIFLEGQPCIIAEDIPSPNDLDELPW